MTSLWSPIAPPRISRDSPQDIFDAQLDVRELLRAQTRTGWVIISTGMFVSCLFEPAFGVVDLKTPEIVFVAGEAERRLGAWADTSETI